MNRLRAHKKTQMFISVLKKMLSVKIKNLLLAIILLTTINNAVAQEKPEIYLLVNPTWSTRHLASEYGRSYITGDPERHRPLVRYDIGAMVTFLKVRQFSMVTGVVYSRKGFSWGKYSYQDIGPNGWRMVTPEMIENYGFIQVPVKLRYALKNSLFFTIGISNDFLSNHKLKIKSNPQPSEPVADLGEARKYNMGLSVSVGKTVIISEKHVIGIEPNFQIQTRSQYVYDRPKILLCNIGICVSHKIPL